MEDTQKELEEPKPDPDEELYSIFETFEIGAAEHPRTLKDSFDVFKELFSPYILTESKREELRAEGEIKGVNNLIGFYEKWIKDYPGSKTGPMITCSGMLKYLKDYRSRLSAKRGK